MKNFKKLVPQPFKKKIIVICGQLHSGKSFLNKLVCSLGETNFPSFDYNFEYLLDLYKLKKISYVDFKSIFEFYLNTILVNKNLGRYVNLRKGDEGSIYTADKKIIFRTLKNLNSKPSSREIIKKIKKNNSIIIQLHNLLSCRDAIFKVFNNYKVINIMNHPIDQIYSIKKKYKKFGEPKYPSNKIVAESKYEYKKKMFSIQALGLEKKFNKLQNFQKILYSKEKKDQIELKNIKKINKFMKKNFLNIYYEDFFIKEKKTLKKIQKFLKIKSSLQTKKIFKSTDFKSRLKFYEFTKKNREIFFKDINKKERRTLDKLVKYYGNIKKYFT